MQGASAWQRGVWLLLWSLVGVAKTAALALLLTDADAFWPMIMAALLLALVLVGAALAWRYRVMTGLKI